MTPKTTRIVTAEPTEFGAVAFETLCNLLGEFDAPVVGLPTGRTPVALYEEMTRRHFDFAAGARLFAIDEYCTSGPHEGTNAAFFGRHLRARVCDQSVIVPRADAIDPEQEIQRFCVALTGVGGFDIAVVGIGDNGHVAFNEPGSAIDSACRVVHLAPSTRAQVAGAWDPPPERGMTVGMAHIMAADQVVLLASGLAKAHILSAALSGPVTERVPASFLQLHPSVTVVSDTLALSRQSQ